MSSVISEVDWRFLELKGSKIVGVAGPYILLYRSPSELKYSWKLYLHWLKRAASWEDRYQEISSFSTIEDVYRGYKTVGNGYLLEPCWSLSLFKLSTLPDWNHSSNVGGGYWVVNFRVNETKNNILEQWKELFFRVQFDSLSIKDHVINGIMLKCLKTGRFEISVWLNPNTKRSNIIWMGHAIKTCLKFSKSLEYIKHNDAKTKRKALWRKI